MVEKMLRKKGFLLRELVFLISLKVLGLVVLMIVIMRYVLEHWVRRASSCQTAPSSFSSSYAKGFVVVVTFVFKY